MGITQPTVTRALKLLELPDEVRRQVEQGAVTASAGYQLSKLADSKEQVAVARQVIAGTIPGNQVQAVVKERKTRRRGKLMPPRLNRYTGTTGTVEVREEAAATADGIQTILLEILDQLRVIRAS